MLIFSLFFLVKRLKLLNCHFSIDFSLIFDALGSCSESKRGEGLVEVVLGGAASDD